jgi:hypothetical protein
MVSTRGSRDGFGGRAVRAPRPKARRRRFTAAALQRVLAAGASADDLTAVVRSAQAEIVFNVCELLDGEGLDELRARIPGLPARSWRLYQVEEDEDFVPTALRPIESLHESVDAFDPQNAQP